MSCSKNTTYKISLTLFSIAIIWLFSSCQTTNENSSYYPIQVKKHRGAHVFGLDSTTSFEFLHRNNIDWVTIVPWGYQENCNSAEVGHNRGDSIQLLKTNKMYHDQIKQLQKAGFKVFIKPHIWILNPGAGKWRSDIMPSSEKEWKKWRVTYREFILRYLEVAIEADAEMFCIGTELTRLTMEESDFWNELIEEVRLRYSGKITYAANWYKEYEAVSFWDKLDYIGVQAYFPLVNKKLPSVSEISKGWNKYKPSLEAKSEKYNKPILFTEIGYKSCEDSAIHPWEWIEDHNGTEKKHSAITQENCYKSFFNTIWPEPWFAGAHLWQWNTYYVDRNMENTNIDFTPQGKPAENVIGIGFARTKN